MQLINKQTKPKNIRKLLKTATGCLLGASSLVNADDTFLNGWGTDLPVIGDPDVREFLSEWETDIAILGYSEVDRVSALEPTISTSKTFDDESVVSLKLALDTLTGASPNGASPSNEVQTFTRPSGAGSYQIAPGDTPLDDTFKDTRYSFSGSYQYDLNRMDKLVWGGSASNEFDFFSTGFSLSYLHDFNNRLNTVSIGIGGEYDIISVEGGTPIALSQMQATSEEQSKSNGSESRVLAELIVGLTHIVDRNTIAQFNYGYGQSNGYHNDPYKITSVVDDVTGESVAGDSLSGKYLYDSRPDSRNKHSFYGQVKHAFGEDSADISYRYMFDDWGVDSHTLDLTYRKNFDDWYIQPSIRYYTQSAADFYRHSLSESDVATIEDYLTSDYRLAEMWSTTLGIKVGFETPNGNKNSVRFAYYYQDGNTSPSDAVGVQKNYDMFPTLDAFIVQYTYSF